MAIDPSAVIAPSARIHTDAVVGPRTRIGEFCVIEQDVTIGADCVFEPYCFVKRWTSLGDGNEISAGTALGTDPLDKGFTGERSYLRIGNGNKIREHYTISRGTKPESVTTIGDLNYIMTSGHVAHNCTLGSNLVIASCSLVAGYVEVEDQAFISGGVVIHQYSKIGRLAMVAGSGMSPAGTDPSSGGEGWWVAAHAYSVLDYDDAAQTITLRNPWGARPAPDGVFTLPLTTFLATYDSYSTSAPPGK